jgi:hypothetical protein
MKVYTKAEYFTELAVGLFVLIPMFYWGWYVLLALAVIYLLIFILKLNIFILKLAHKHIVKG